MKVKDEGQLVSSLARALDEAYKTIDDLRELSTFLMNRNSAANADEEPDGDDA